MSVTHSIPPFLAPARAAIAPSFTALSVPNFRRFAGSNMLAMTATWMQRIAQDWLVLELTGSVAAVGVTTAMQFGPMLLFGLYGGVIVDRYPKRSLLMVTQSAVGVVSLALAALALTGTATVWLVWAAAFLIGCVTVVDNPARQVFVNELVGPRHLTNAITINSAVFQFGGLLGPALSGLLLAAIGGGWAFAVNAAACAVTVVMLRHLDTAALHPIPAPPRAPGQLREGVRFVARTPAIRYSVVMLAFVAVCTLPMPVLLAGYASDVFAVGASGYGFFNSCVAVGALVGAIASTRRTTIRLRTVILSAGAWAATVILAACMPTEPLFAVALAASGFANQFFFMAGNPLVQMSSPHSVRGRVMAVWVLVVLGGQAIGGPVMGWLGDVLGPQAALFLAGAIPLVGALALALLIARRGALRLGMAAHHHRLPHPAIVTR